MNDKAVHASDELERVKRLIRKLDARTTENGCTEAEAMESAEKIGQLLAQFELELTDVIISEEICVQREVFAADEAMGSVIVGIGRLCSLRVYHKTGSSPVTYVLFGMSRDVELAVYLYELCVEAADMGWSEWIHSGRGHTVKQRESYRAGFGSRVSIRMSEMRDARDREREERLKTSGSRDLVLVRDAVVDEEFAKTGVRLVARRASRVRDNTAYGHGYEHGGNVNLNSPLGGPGSMGVLS